VREAPVTKMTTAVCVGGWSALVGAQPTPTQLKQRSVVTLITTTPLATYAGRAGRADHVAGTNAVDAVPGLVLEYREQNAASSPDLVLIGRAPEDHQSPLQGQSWAGPRCTTHCRGTRCSGSRSRS